MKLAWTALAWATCIALFAGACGEDGGPDSPATPGDASAVGTSVDSVRATPVGELFEVRLGNQDVSPNPLPLPAYEPITLRLLNTSPSVVHSMKLWDADPLTSSDAVLLGETGDMGPSAERDLTVTLEPHEYFLICEYHVAFGMSGSIEASAAETVGG